MGEGCLEALARKWDVGAAGKVDREVAGPAVRGLGVATKGCVTGERRGRREFCGAQRVVEGEGG